MARRPQPGVETVDVPLAGNQAQDGDDTLGQMREIFLEAALAEAFGVTFRRGDGMALSLKNKDNVQV